MTKILKIAGLSIGGIFLFLLVLGIILELVGYEPDLPEAETENPPVEKVTQPTVDKPKTTEPKKPAPPKKSAFLKLAEKATHGITAPKLWEAFDTNELAANSKYKGKIILVRGDIAGLRDTLGSPYIDLNTGEFFDVSCEMQKSELPKLEKLVKGQDIVVIGKCKGSFGGISVELDDCLVMLSSEYAKLGQE